MSEKEDLKMSESISNQIVKALKSDAYFVTVTRRENKKLYHWQTHSFDFYFKELLPSLQEIKKLLYEMYPGLKYMVLSQNREIKEDAKKT